MERASLGSKLAVACRHPPHLRRQEFAKDALVHDGPEIPIAERSGGAGGGCGGGGRSGGGGRGGGAGVVVVAVLVIVVFPGTMEVRSGPVWTI